MFGNKCRGGGGYLCCRGSGLTRSAELTYTYYVSLEKVINCSQLIITNISFIEDVSFLPWDHTFFFSQRIYFPLLHFQPLLFTFLHDPWNNNQLHRSTLSKTSKIYYLYFDQGDWLVCIEKTLSRSWKGYLLSGNKGIFWDTN